MSLIHCPRPVISDAAGSCVCPYQSTLDTLDLDRLRNQNPASALCHKLSDVCNCMHVFGNDSTGVETGYLAVVIGIRP